jgi:hypothetical protein
MATRKCPDCSEQVDAASVNCKFCGYNFRSGGAMAQAPSASSGSALNGRVVLGIVFIIIGALLFAATMNSPNRSFPAGVITMGIGVLNIVRGLSSR